MIEEESQIGSLQVSRFKIGAVKVRKIIHAITLVPKLDDKTANDFVLIMKALMEIAEDYENKDNSYRANEGLS